jgi:hypothetical protein
VSKEFSTELNIFAVIHVQHRNGRPARWRETDDKRPAPFKVRGPVLRPRIEQRNHLPRGGIYATAVKILWGRKWVL